jgi:hypothetical protein
MPLSIRGQKEVLVNATLPTLGTAATVLGVELTGTLWSSSKWTSHFTFEHLEISACEQKRGTRPQHRLVSLRGRALPYWAGPHRRNRTATLARNRRGPY